MELVSPSHEFEAAFAAFYDDFLANDHENSEYYLAGKQDFTSYVKHLLDEANGVNLADGYVPCNHYWLVNDNKSILGAIRVRHNIDNEFLALEAGHIGYDMAPSFRQKGNGKLMLKLALAKAKALGIDSALITADEDNLASRSVIESNGGQFDRVVIGKVFPNPIARYWVDCS
ncbi:GNAT family N-acetyltransferase [Photobacterium sanguinicancri]|uniref:GNAT family N-acetyltransferase n=1 Tax=Photobacterium sanguinicancri TaxID=875932 RepID=A0AAW7Y970_9GAMM|nr:GNAT family N-acetyltransferase [Photobacterium sanguinicancri]MDO6544882.1 GNAT family N-acetyltransferase [Photobacterium sanguinicancri]